ncbi:hypothetical protein B0H14DRAFT_2624938 [Mycena olivaceomarginata]|nr:hypothetical protein B0H14DRAFT_2624938 [Mycena olivaceomarginata]
MASYLSSGYPPRPLAVLQSIAAKSASVPVMGRVVSVDTRCADLLSVSVGTRANLPLFEPSLSLDNVVSSASNSDEGLGLGSRTPVVVSTHSATKEMSREDFVNLAHSYLALANAAMSAAMDFPHKESEQRAAAQIIAQQPIDSSRQLVNVSPDVSSVVDQDNRVKFETIVPVSSVGIPMVQAPEPRRRWSGLDLISVQAVWSMSCEELFTLAHLVQNETSCKDIGDAHHWSNQDAVPSATAKIAGRNWSNDREKGPEPSLAFINGLGYILLITWIKKLGGFLPGHIRQHGEVVNEICGLRTVSFIINPSKCRQITITQEVIDPWILAFDVATRVNSATSKPENQYGSPGPVIRPTARGITRQKTASTRGFWDRVDHDLAERREKTMEHPAETRAALSSVVFEESLKAHIGAGPLGRGGEPKAGKQMPDWQKIIARSVEEMDKYTLEELAGEEPDSDHESHENQLDSLSSLGSASTGPN